MSVESTTLAEKVRANHPQVVRVLGDATSDRLDASNSGGGVRREYRRSGDDGTPVIFLLARSYEARFPNAKSLCTRPQVVFDGVLEVDGEPIVIDGWTRLKLGPLWTPPMTIVCLRSVNRSQAGVRIHGRIHAAPKDFVSLTYCNPTGGTHASTASLQRVN